VDGLSTLRTLLWSFVAMPVVLLLVAFLVAGDGGDTSTAVVAVALVGWSLLTQVLGRVLPPPLAGEDAAELASSYRTRFFVRLAIFESAALLGFVAAIVTGNPWVHVIGLVSTEAGFAAAAPTDTNLARDQEALRGRGSALDLVASLRGVEG
jgi:hypothetical protein